MFDNPGDFKSMVRARMGIKPAQPQNPQPTNMPFNHGIFNKMGGMAGGYLPYDPRLNYLPSGGATVPIPSPVNAPYSLPTPGQIGTPKSQIQPNGLPPDVSLPDPVGIGPDGPINKKSLYRQVFGD